MKQKYFHELTERQLEKFVDKITWEELAAKYPQPEWCSYPNAVNVLGCWSLIYNMVTGEDYCKDCDCYRPVKKYCPKDCPRLAKNKPLKGQCPPMMLEYDWDKKRYRRYPGCPMKKEG